MWLLFATLGSDEVSRGLEVMVRNKSEKVEYLQFGP